MVYLTLVLIVLKSTNFGLGAISLVFINFYIILKSKSIIKIQPLLSIYYILFFISTILYNMFWDIELINRLNSYFKFFTIITLSATIYYSKTKQEKYISILLVFLLILLYQAGIYNIYKYIGN